MKKVIVLMLLAFPAIMQAQTTGPFEQSVKGKTAFLPVLKKGYRPQIGISLVGGTQSYSNFDKGTFVYGIDLSLQCPLLCTKKNYIRQQLSIVNHDGSLLKSVTAELNPQYRIIAKPKFELGVGPSLGVIFAKANGDSKVPFTYGLGGSIAYHFSKVFIALESRYGLTHNVSFTNANDYVITENLNNLRTILKVGFKF